MHNTTFIKKIPPNVEGRDFIVGDLHGCFEDLGKLLIHVKFDPNKDRLFCTGDLIDRGPRSEDCLKLLNKKWFFAVKGNHEDMLLTKFRLLDENSENLNMTMKEKLQLLSFKKYNEKLLQMPFVYEVEHLLFEKFYIVHAEILPEHLFPMSMTEIKSQNYLKFLIDFQKEDFSEQIEKFFNNNNSSTLSVKLKQKLVWSRKIISSFYKINKNDIDNGNFEFIEKNKVSNKYKIFCGHNVVPFPMKIGQQFYIDTGAALGHTNQDNAPHLFTQFGHQFFTLSLIDVTTGFCYGVITESKHRNYGKVMKLAKSLY